MFGFTSYFIQTQHITEIICWDIEDGYVGNFN